MKKFNENVHSDERAGNIIPGKRQQLQQSAG